MGKWAILELEGDWAVTGFRVTLEIRTEQELQILQAKGSLPPNPSLVSYLKNHWQAVYRPLGTSQRIKGQKIIYKGSINQRVADCQRSAQVLCDRFRTWLNAESFQPIDRRLREELSRDENIQFLIQTLDTNLQKLPWHEWDFFERYPKAEIAFGMPQYEWVQLKTAKQSPHPVRILAVLGHSLGIDIEADRQVLAQLPQTHVSFLVEPKLQHLNEELWKSPWDILFFAGHSETHRGHGRIFINETDSLSLSELRYGLHKAIHQGLRLAIFNSCDGLGLMQTLGTLGIPQMIVMREPVADQVAESFLKYFLEAFSAGESLYSSTRQARERLQGLEHQFPCASWLPVLYQNPLVKPPDWSTLQDQSRPTQRPKDAVPLASSPVTFAKTPTKRLFPGFRVLQISFAVTMLIVFVRLLGLLQPLELAAYDHLLRSRPAETIDSRILVVEVTQADLNELGGYPLTDTILAQAIDTLQAFEPTAIALDMHRHRPRGEGRQALISQFQQSSNLFTVCAFDQADKDYEPPPEFSKEQLITQVGFSNFVLDAPFLTRSHNQVALHTSQENWVVRRHLLTYDPDLAVTQSLCSTPYSLSFQLAYQFLMRAQVDPITVNENNQWQFGSVILQPLTSRFGGYQNLDGLSTQLMLNYRTAPPGQQISLQQVLAGQFSPDRVEGRLILLGYTAPVARDTVNTPYGEMAGVWLHAHMLSQLLSGILQQRPFITVLPQWLGLPWGDGGWILGWSLLGGSLSSWFRTFKSNKHYLGKFLGCSLAFVGSSWLLFHGCLLALTRGLWLPLIPAILSVLVTGACVVWRETFKTSA